ncbi:MAG: permease-like cell division protein FtsX [Turicibacter sp.]|nr:permease-like cell division protein FtsX [Turicibacter sp.]
MKLRQFQRNVRDGFKNTWNHLFMSLSSVITLTITLSLCAGFLLFAANTQEFTRGIEGEVRIFAQISPEAEDEDIQQILDTIDSIPEASVLSFNTGEEEYAYVMARMAGDDEQAREALSLATEGLQLPSTVIIDATSVDYVRDVATQVDGMDHIMSVNFGDEEMLSTLTTLTGTIRNVMIILVAVLMVLAVFLIQNTIKLTIYSRQEELKIQKLVGASVIHVTVPFIVEGLIIGVLGASIPILLTMIGYAAIYREAGGFMVVQLLSMAGPNPLVYQIGFGMGLISIGVSLLGSFFAVSRYALKE